MNIIYEVWDDDKDDGSFKAISKPELKKELSEWAGYGLVFLGTIRDGDELKIRLCGPITKDGDFVTVAEGNVPLA